MAFKSLVDAISGQRQEIKRALASLPYFDTWDDKVITECCQISAIMEFSPDEIILGPGTANSHVTFFIIEGICKVIRYIQARVVTDSRRRTTYKLYKKCENKKTANLPTNSVKYASLLFSGKHDFQKEKKTIQIDDNLSLEKNLEVKMTDLTITEDKKQEVEFEPERENIKSDIKKRDAEVAEKQYAAVELKTEENHRDDGKKKKIILKREMEKQNSSGEKETNRESMHESTQDEEIENSEEMMDEELKELKEEQEKFRKTFQSDRHLKVLEKCKEKSQELKKLSNNESVPERPEDVKTFFVQVALFYKGACFGFEDRLKDTFIMSATKVKCLRIPRRFLLRHNPCNIWNRIRLFFRLYLPSEKKILQYVVSNRKWNNQKRKLSEEIVRRKNIPNYILSSEVPFSIRLLEVPR